MNIAESRLAFKYAQAILNVYPHTAEIMSQVVKPLIHFFESAPAGMQYVLFSNAKTTQLQFIEKLISSYHLPETYKKVLYLLYKQNRLWLLPLIVTAIQTVYYKENNMSIWTVESTQPLTNEQKQLIIQLLHEKTKKKIVPQYKINTRLLGGLKLYSENILWDDSVKRKLEELQGLLTKQGIAYGN